MAETPLETAQRLWPGEWEEQAWGLCRRLRSEDGREWALIEVFETGKWEWFANFKSADKYVGIAPGHLEHVIATSRDKVRDFARAAGVEVVSEAPPL